MRAPTIKLKGYSIAVSSQFFIWLILIFATLLFAQSLKLPVSNMLFRFTLVMPIGALIQPVLAAIFIRTSVNLEKVTVEKHTPIELKAIISSSCILPFPFIEAELYIPDERGISCTSKSFILSLPPLGAYSINRSVEFSFRGEYCVGIKSISVCDFFRTVKITIPCERYENIFVLPRRFELAPRQTTQDSMLEREHVIRAKGSDNTELSDIRDYINGDSLKRIHWKLSLKTDELFVKEYSQNNGSSVCILCDLEPHYANLGEKEPIAAPLPEYAQIIDMLNTDLVVETCIACTLRELNSGNDVTLMWISDGKPHKSELHSIKDFDNVYRHFATAPLDKAEKHLTSLLLAKPEGNSSSLILVTAYIDEETASEYSSVAAMYHELGTKAPEMLYCADESLFVEDEESKKRLNDCLYELERAGISVIKAERNTNLN